MRLMEVYLRQKQITPDQAPPSTVDPEIEARARLYASQFAPMTASANPFSYDDPASETNPDSEDGTSTPEQQ